MDGCIVFAGTEVGARTDGRPLGNGVGSIDEGEEDGDNVEGYVGSRVG